MQPMFIDEVKKLHNKKLLPPGPGTYVPPKSFGNIGQKKSFHSRLSYDTIELRNSALLPGPGDYNSTDRLPDIKKGVMTISESSSPLMNTI